MGEPVADRRRVDDDLQPLRAVGAFAVRVAVLRADIDGRLARQLPARERPEFRRIIR
jgi:hypothetical protein